jgi:mevalonate kinase
MSTKSYPSKILLFGEYTIIKGAYALAIPVFQFSGKWDFVRKNQANIFRADLDKFADYLDELNKKGNELNDLDINKFKKQIQKGLYFNSNIPHGYGAGSSGALCAAVYERFSNKKNIATNAIGISELRNNLARLESFFHGSSSGIDPLVSFINQSVLIKHGQNKLVQLPSSNNSKGVVFLLDTGIERKTEPFVKLFLDKCKEDTFVKVCEKQLSVYNEKAIEYFLNAQWKELFKMVHQISLFQLEYFNEMIPKEFVSDWKLGLKKDLFKLKLCGAGGGGFILGFTANFEETAQALSNKNLMPIFKF